MLQKKKKNENCSGHFEQSVLCILLASKTRTPNEISTTLKVHIYEVKHFSSFWVHTNFFSSIPLT